MRTGDVEQKKLEDLALADNLRRTDPLPPLEGVQPDTRRALAKIEGSIKSQIILTLIEIHGVGGMKKVADNIGLMRSKHFWSNEGGAVCFAFEDSIRDALGKPDYWRRVGLRELTARLNARLGTTAFNEIRVGRICKEHGFVSKRHGDGVGYVGGDQLRDMCEWHMVWVRYQACRLV